MIRSLESNGKFNRVAPLANLRNLRYGIGNKNYEFGQTYSQFEQLFFLSVLHNLQTIEIQDPYIKQYFGQMTECSDSLQKVRERHFETESKNLE
jgi:hypothetical protein